MADIRDPFAKPNLSAGRDLVSRPNFTIPGADTPQMSAARPTPDSVMPSRPTGRDLVTRPNFTMGGKAPLPMVDEVVRAPTQPVSPTVRDPRFATKPLSPEAQQFRSTMFQGPKTPPGWAPPNAAPAAAPTAQMPSTGGLRRAATDLLGSKDQWKDFAGGGGKLRAELGKGVSYQPPKSAPTATAKGVGLLQGAAGAYNAYQGVKEGDALKTVVGSADAIASGALFTPAAPAAAAYLGARGAWDTGQAVGGAINDSLSDDTKDVIGGTINQALRWFGGGVDDSALLAQKAQERLTQPAAAAAQPAATAAQPTTAAAQPTTAAAQPAATAVQQPGPVSPLRKTVDANGRTTYEGTSVSAGAPIVGADGNTLRTGGTVNSLPAGASPFSSFGLGGSDAAVSQARQAAAARGDWDAVSRSYGEAPQGGQGGPSLRMGGGGYSAGPSVPAHVAQSEKFAQQAARSDAESAARAALKSGSLRERSRGMATLAQLAGGDQDAATSRYNTDATAATARYGSDNSLRGQVYSADSQNDANRYAADMGLRSAYAKNMPAQMQRQAQSMAMQMAGGDIPTALKILAQNGYSGEGLIATQNALNSDQTTQQNLYKGAEEGAMARFKNFVPTDAEGKPVYGGEAQVMNAIESAVPGYSRMGADAQARYAPTVQSTLSIIKGLNTTANNSLLQTIGWDPANPRIDQLPGLNGAKLGQVGKLSGLLPGDGVSSGDYSLDLGGGRVLYLPRDQIGENELALLRAKGVNVPQ